MRNTLFAAVIGAAVAAGIVVVLVGPSSNGATAQTKANYSKEQAQCMLRYLDKANTERAVGMLFNACKTLFD